MTRNVIFPETPYVECVFSLENGSTASCGREYDRYGIIKDACRSKLKRYVYKLPSYMQGMVKVGDFVLVRCATGFQPCQIVEVNAITSYEGKIQPVVCPINIEMYCEELDKELALKQMRAQIEEEKKRLEASITYDILAEKNEDFREMLKQFKEAGGVI